jgi:hypothetical protein
MKIVRSLVLGSAAGLLLSTAGLMATSEAEAAPAVEYVRICSLYGAGFWYIPGTDTCIKIGGSIRLDTDLNGGIYDNPFWQGGASASQAYGKNWYTVRTRFNLTEDTRTATEYGVLRTYANVQMDWTGNGGSGIAGGAPVEVDLAFIQFAGFTFGKAVSEFDPQWALAKPTITSGMWAGSNNATGIPQLAYTATFGNGVSGTISLEDGQPYRTAGLVNTSTATLNFLTASTPPAGSYGVGNFTGNAVAGDHIPDVVGNLRLDQTWGSLHFGAAAHEVHGNYYGADSSTGHPGATYGYAVSGAFELKNLPTGTGDSFKAEASFAHGAAKYVWGGTIDTAGAGRLFRTSGTTVPGTLATGFILDGIYSGTTAATGTAINLSNSWEVSAFYEHYWNPAWRTSLFGNYSAITYGAGGAALLAALANPAQNPASGFFTLAPGAKLNFSTAQVGTRTAWTPVKDLTISAEFLYSYMMPKLAGSTFTSTGGISGAPIGSVWATGNQSVYNGGVQITRGF